MADAGDTLNDNEFFADIVDTPKEGPVIKDQMANLGCLFEFTFGDYLAPVLIDAHTANNVDFVGEPEDEGYESEA